MPITNPNQNLNAAELLTEVCKHGRLNAKVELLHFATMWRCTLTRDSIVVATSMGSDMEASIRRAIGYYSEGIPVTRVQSETWVRS